MGDKSNYIIPVWILLGYSIVIPASYIPDATIRAIVVTFGFISVVPGMLLQEKIAKWVASNFKHFHADFFSNFRYRAARTQLWFRKDPVETLSEAVNQQGVPIGFKQVYIDLERFPIDHPRYGKVWRIFIRFEGDWKKRILQLGGFVTFWGLRVPHNATDKVVLYEVDLIVDQRTLITYPVYELRHATGDFKIIMAKRQQMKQRLIAPVIPR